MGEPEVTYDFYHDSYGGRALGMDDLEAALPHARAAVRSLVWPNDPSRDEDAYRRAVCAACEVDAAYGFTGGAGSLSSVTAGTVSMAFGSGGGSYDGDVARAVRGELAGTGLLYAGIG